MTSIDDPAASPDTSTDLRELVDRLAIVEVCNRMVWHADQRQWDRLRSVFADQVTLDYTSLNGGAPAVLTPGEVAAGWLQALGGYDATHHLLSNQLVTVNGDSAKCTALFQATHRLATSFGAPLWTLGGTYRFDLLRIRGGWRISGVVMTATWADGNQQLTNLAMADVADSRKERSE